MKLTDLHKNKGLKINNSIQPHGAIGKPGGTPAPLDKREQRKADAARGLVPFACKLPMELVGQLRASAAERQVELNDLVEELLAAAMAGGGEKKKSTGAKKAGAGEEGK